MSVCEFADGATMHGFNHIFKKEQKTLRTVIWSLAFIGSVILFLLQCAPRVLYWLSSPHVTNVEEVSAVLLNFPSVTICNTNPLRFSKMTKNDMYWTGAYLGFTTVDHILLEPTIPSVDIVDQATYTAQLQRLRFLTDFVNFLPSADFSMLEFFGRVGFQYEDVILQCTYRGEPCRKADFVITFTEYGKCFTFNQPRDSSQIKQTLKGGLDNGLELVLNVIQSDHLPIVREMEDLNMQSGFKIHIHDPAEPNFVKELGFGVIPGKQTLVSVQEQRITFLPPPWGVCDSGSDKSDYRFFEDYSTAACRVSCQTEYVTDACGCRMVHQPKLDTVSIDDDARYVNTPICTSAQYKCAQQNLDYLVAVDNSRCVCKTPCNVLKFSSSQSFLDFPSLNALSLVCSKFGQSPATVKSNLAKLNIYFGELNFQTVTQIKSYNFGSLLGDIGGQMGLFIGASILTRTLLEFGEFFVLTTFAAFRSRWLKLRSNNKQQRPPGSIRHEYASTNVDEVADLRRKLENYRMKLDVYEANKGLVSEL